MIVLKKIGKNPGKSAPADRKPGHYIVRTETNSWYERIRRFLAFALSTLIGVLALSAAVTPSLYGDPSEVCNAQSDWRAESKFSPIRIMTMINASLVRCENAPVEEAKKAIAIYFGRSAGDNPFRGWETLSLELQSRYSYDAFVTQWNNVGYAELLDINKEPINQSDGKLEALPYNTFEVTTRLFQLDSKYSIDESQIDIGWVPIYKYHVRVKREAGSWVVDRVYSLDQSAGERPYGHYGIIRLDTGKSAYSIPEVEESAITWTTKRAKYGKLPFYCKTEVTNKNGQKDAWYRTSLGWVQEKDVDRTVPWDRETNINGFDGRCNKDTVYVEK